MRWEAPIKLVKQQLALLAVLSFICADLWARQTSQSSTDADTWCTGPSSKEVCADKDGNFIPSVTNNQSLGTSGLKWSTGYFTGAVTAGSLTVGDYAFTSDVSTFNNVVVNSSFTVRGGVFGDINASTYTMVVGTYADATSTDLTSCIAGSTVTLVTGNVKVRVEWAGGFLENDTNSQPSNSGFMIDGAFPDSLTSTKAVMGGGTTSASSAGMRYNAGFTYTTRSKLTAGTHRFCFSFTGYAGGTTGTLRCGDNHGACKFYVTEVR